MHKTMTSLVNFWWIIVLNFGSIFRKETILHSEVHGKKTLLINEYNEQKTSKQTHKGNFRRCVTELFQTFLFIFPGVFNSDN